MGRLLDLIDANRQSGDPDVKTYDKNDINDKSPPFSRCGRLCRTSPFLIMALEALERRCPEGVESGHWQRGVEDGRRFLWQWGEQAERLGWSEADIFGLPPTPRTRTRAGGD